MASKWMWMHAHVCVCGDVYGDDDGGGRLRDGWRVMASVSRLDGCGAITIITPQTPTN